MIISVKDLLKLFGISIVCCCAVFVCTFMINFYIDAQNLSNVPENLQPLYEAQLLTAKFTSAITGGFLGLIAVVMLFFYIKLFISSHSIQLGILKAMGYSNTQLALRFWVFGFSVFIGTALGYGLGHAFMPMIYKSLTIDGLSISVNYHVGLLFAFVVAPTVIYGVLACVFALFSLKEPVTSLMRGRSEKVKKVKSGKSKDRPFLKEMFFKSVTSKKLVTFFITFGAFCFSAMVQMAFSMKEVSAESFADLILVIGLVLTVVVSFMSVTTLVNANTENISIMKAMGYSLKECVFALFGGFIPFLLLGFAIGTVYQFGLLSLMVNVIFADVDTVISYSFDVPLMFITFAAFIVFYAALILIYSLKMSKISVKQTAED